MFNFSWAGLAAGKESTCNVGDLGSIPGLGSSPGGGKGDPLQYWPGEPHGLYSPWRRKELDTTECPSLSQWLGRASPLLRPEGGAVAARAFSRQRAGCP